MWDNWACASLTQCDRCIFHEVVIWISFIVTFKNTKRHMTNQSANIFPTLGTDSVSNNWVGFIIICRANMKQLGSKKRKKLWIPALGTANLRLYKLLSAEVSKQKDTQEEFKETVMWCTLHTAFSRAESSPPLKVMGDHDGWAPLWI